MASRIMLHGAPAVAELAVTIGVVAGTLNASKRKVRLRQTRQTSRPATRIIAIEDRLNVRVQAQNPLAGVRPVLQTRVQNRQVQQATASAALTSSESLLRPVLVRAALISPASTRALTRSLREPSSLPLAANVESAKFTRADVIGSIDLVRVSERLCPCSRVFFDSFW